MQLHQLSPNKKDKRKRRVGRGGKRGTYSGRGIKGQGARAGERIRPALRDLIKSIHKLRGYNDKRPTTPERVPVNIEFIANHFEEGDEITEETLLEAGINKDSEGPLKILGKGEIDFAVTIKDLEISEGAEEKIVNAGGEVS